LSALTQINTEPASVTEAPAEPPDRAAAETTMADIIAHFRAPWGTIYHLLYVAALTRSREGSHFLLIGNISLQNRNIGATKDS
jgi:hypothetical protein